ncbi:hypothetical protein BJ944DRAFT_18595 [Cunninghamella echinulata]|nr:hypothetical protein BJ944DRAFT_18595 [Cunninghamella echinulata]
MSPKNDKKSNLSTSGSKKIRMTLACERCRSKKVKCDFSHPICKRCEQAKVSCSYIGSSTQVDLFSLVKMNETVDFLQQKIRSLESKMEQDNNEMMLPTNSETTSDMSSKQLTELGSDDNKILQGLLNAANSRWNLSLTPNGLRIDTNIISIHDLYDLLLTGMSQLEINDPLMDTITSDNEGSNQSVSSSGSTIPDTSSSTTVRRTALLKKKPLWKTGLKVFPLYSSWESSTSASNNSMKKDTKLPKSTLDTMMDIYTECFLCLPSPELHGSILDRYKKGELDEMLESIIFAWTARHGAIYHNLFPGQDPNQVGESFFNNAKMLLRDRFLDSNIDTMHSLLMMYIYTLGDPSSHAESEAYMYLGLANRMCLDLKIHCELPSNFSEIDQERNRRYYGVLNFLETLCTVHSDKPFSLPPHNTVTVGFPTVMPHETGEVRWRVEFMIHRFRITRIYRDIIFKTAQEKPLLSTISALDKELKEWYQQLPSYFKYKSGDAYKKNWKSKSFKEQACIKLNFEYNFQMCQLYGLFFSRACDNNESPSAIDVLSKELCVRSAETIVELLSCWVQLEQRWCHFSLETFMIVLIIYGTILINATESEKESAKLNLSNMARMLAHSPVSHHKHVIGLVKRIQQMFLEFFNKELNLNIDQRKSTKREHMKHELSPPSSTITLNLTSHSSPSSPLPSPPLLTTASTSKMTITKPCMGSPPLKSRKTKSLTTASSINTSSFDTSSPSSSSSSSVSQQPILLSEYRTEPTHDTNAYFNSFYTSNQNAVVDIQTGTSPFDIHKANSLSIMTASDLPFSDFLYTPTLIGLQPIPVTLNNNNTQGSHHYHQQQHYQSNQDQRNTATSPMTSTDLAISQSQLSPTSSLMPSQVNIGYTNYHVSPSHSVPTSSHWQSRLMHSTTATSPSTTIATPTIPSSIISSSHHQQRQQQQQENNTTPPIYISLPPSQSPSATTNVLHYHANVNSSSHVSNVTSSFSPTDPYLEMNSTLEQSTDRKLEGQKNHGFDYC